ncbi:MAG: DUF4214 domain-containing protein [Candidatus Riflebacteria bacterium]
MRTAEGFLLTVIISILFSGVECVGAITPEEFLNRRPDIAESVKNSTGKTDPVEVIKIWLQYNSTESSEYVNLAQEALKNSSSQSNSTSSEGSNIQNLEDMLLNPAREEAVAFVTGLYHELLHRAPDPEGLTTWVNVLVSGKMTKEQVKTAICNSEEYKNLHPQPSAKGDISVDGIRREVRASSPVHAIADRIVAIAAAKRVPVWLLLSQTINETSAGNPANGTCAPNRYIYNHFNHKENWRGNPHNLFNITLPRNPSAKLSSCWEGHVVIVGPSDDRRKFKAYRSWEKSVEDYCDLISTVYRGMTLEKLVYTYYPSGDGNSVYQNRPERYIANIIALASRHGIKIDRRTVPCP